MHGVRARRAALALAGACACLLPAWSAVLYRPPAGNRPPQISISGDLVPKDLEEFTAVAETARAAATAFIASRGVDRAPPGRGFVNVALDSRGGNIWVATRPGWRVLVRAGLRCARPPDRRAGAIPPECGVLIAREERLVVARPAVHRALPRMPFGVWMALAKAQPVAGFDEEAKALLVDLPQPALSLS
jgi:hypothetical protein